MKKIIEQIKSIDGVKTVEPCDDKVLVTFEPEAIAVEATNKEQWDFIRAKTGMRTDFMKGHSVSCGSEEYADTGWLERNGWNVISFTQYLQDYDLKEEYYDYVFKLIYEKYTIGAKFNVVHHPHVTYTVTSHERNERSIVTENNVTHFNLIGNGGASSCGTVYLEGNWAEIIKEVELIEGEIYRSKKFNVIFRSKTESLVNTDDDKEYELSVWDDDKEYERECKPATNKQKRKLIRAEVNNGYFHELRNQ